jgi:hypothetical protein
MAQRLPYVIRALMSKRTHLHTDCVYVFHVILGENTDYFSKKN